MSSFEFGEPDKSKLGLGTGSFDDHYDENNFFSSFQQQKPATTLTNGLFASKSSPFMNRKQLEDQLFQDNYFDDGDAAPFPIDHDDEREKNEPASKLIAPTIDFGVDSLSLDHLNLKDVEAGTQVQPSLEVYEAKSITEENENIPKLSAASAPFVPGTTTFAPPNPPSYDGPTSVYSGEVPKKKGPPPLLPEEKGRFIWRKKLQPLPPRPPEGTEVPPPYVPYDHYRSPAHGQPYVAPYIPAHVSLHEPAVAPPHIGLARDPYAPPPRDPYLAPRGPYAPPRDPYNAPPSRDPYAPPHAPPPRDYRDRDYHPAAPYDRDYHAPPPPHPYHPGSSYHHPEVGYKAEPPPAFVYTVNTTLNSTLVSI